MISAPVRSDADASITQKSTLLPSRRSLFSSATLTAAILFGVLNLGLWKSDEALDFSSGRKLLQQFDVPRTLREVPHELDQAFAGSSLVLFPLWKLDFPKYTQCGDANHYHSSVTLNKLLSDAHVGNPHPQPRSCTYDLAVGGAMMSDVYLITRQSLTVNGSPRTLIYGCAPRDFYDNNAPTPTSTMIYRYLFPPTEIFSADACRYDSNVWSRFYFALGGLIYFTNHNHEIVEALTKSFAGYLNSLSLAPALGGKDLIGETKATEPCPIKVFQPATSAAASGTQAGGPSPTLGGVALGTCAGGSSGTRAEAASASPRERAEHQRALEASLTEYRARYTNISQAGLGTQLAFAKPLIDLCKARSIKLVLVNMPLSEANRKLLPAQFYSQFNSRITELTKSNDIPLVDLSSSAEFTDSDFDDTVHLNAGGGAKFLQKVLPFILR